MATAKEKRRETRVAVDLWIEAERDGELYYQRAVNLSVGGVFFAQTVPMPVGTTVSLKFTLPGDSQEIACSGEIVTAKELGMGVQFANLTTVDRARIEKVIEHLASKASAAAHPHSKK